ncbi:MAG: sulfotransferase [Gammaproteobacteria bacterium]
MKSGHIKRKIKKILGLSGKDRRGFNHGVTANVQEPALRVAGEIRGKNRAPALIIHGVAPRSGTVYVGELLRLHPDLSAYPNDMWEIPFLETTGDLIDAQRHFINAYKQNKDKIGQHDFLPLFGASLMAYLYSFVPEGKGMLLKIPDVQYLDLFFSVFPNEYPILLLRDGRDVVGSTIKSWPEDDFAEICRLWDLGAKMILEFVQQYENTGQKFLMARYEDVLKDPAGFVRDACERFALNISAYPYDKIPEISLRGSSRYKSDGKVIWDAADKPAGFSPKGHWLEWSSSQKRIFKGIAGQTLIDTGYCQDLNW